MTPSEKEFIVKISPLCSQISHWVKEKNIFMRRKANILQPPVIMAHIVIESQWGTHPISQQMYDKKASNNLALLEVDSLWQGKSNEYNTKQYKSYQSWMHFATDYSDSVVFAGDLSFILMENTVLGQIDRLSKLYASPAVFAAKAQSLIEVHQLGRIFF